ncbi:MAG: hypothetical protein ACI89X_002061 [Planctomycetota bacterium]|jgi:hypothetical protein
MNRLTNNRVFISIVLIVLQLAFLPNVSRCSDSQLLGHLCCCSSSADDSSEGAQRDGTSESKHDCCSKHAAQNKGDESELELQANTGVAGRDGKKECSCSHTRAHATYAVYASKKSDRDLLEKHVTALLPTAARCNQSCHAIEVRVRCKPIPRAQTGPPLQLIYQVFLI